MNDRIKSERTEVGVNSRGMVFCNLCQKDVVPDLLYTIRGYDIVRCPCCELVFLPANAISPTAVADIYSKEYFEGGVPDGYSDYSESEDILRRQAERTLRRLRRYQEAGALLEVGCAYGFFLLEARKWFQSQGIEISAFAAQEARRRGLNVAAGDLLQVELPPAHFEVVCLFDCIEHLTDPTAYLARINNLLKPGGIVVLTTGDIGSLCARLMKSRWRLMTPPQHLFYFRRKTLARMLEQTGFEVLEVSYAWKLVPRRLVLYQISPKLRGALGSLGRLPLGIYVNLFDAVLVVARKR